MSRPAATILAVALAGSVASPALAQQARPARVAIDPSVAVDTTFSDADRWHVTSVNVDAMASVEVGNGFQFLVRPFAQRIGGTEEWNAQLWIAALRYERPGPVGLRVDAGYIPAPIGSANLLLRPHLNATIAQPSSLFSPLPSLMLRGPRAPLLGAIYPLGATATLSGLKWDARASVIDSSPMRSRRMFTNGAPPNPPAFTNVVVGAGVTPFVGFRVGASLARGGWLKAGESPVVTTDRDATITTIESELAFRYTKLLAEWTRDSLDTDSGTHVATGWFAQAQQTLAPRWFVAGRVERIESPAISPLPGVFVTQRLTGVEETLGYRLTTDLTLRASHRARRAFGAPGYVQTFAVSAIWWKRLM